MQNEDLAALAAQQYYVELGAQMNQERLSRMIPSVIPDSLLAGTGAQDKWIQMTIGSFNRVSNKHSAPKILKVAYSIASYTEIFRPVETVETELYNAIYSY